VHRFIQGNLVAEECVIYTRFCSGIRELLSQEFLMPNFTNTFVALEKSKMRAVQLEGHGGPEKLRTVQTTIPQPGVREVLVRVKYASVRNYRCALLTTKPDQSPAPCRHIACPQIPVTETFAAHVAGG
jgi:hypothetical protein